MRIPIAESHCGFLLLLLCALPVNLCAQAAGDGRFGCFDTSVPRTELYKKPHLKFAQVQNPDTIKQWQAHPALVFGGFDASKYHWTEVRFYPGHVPAGDSTDHREEGDSTDRLALAIRRASTAGSWK